MQKFWLLLLFVYSTNIWSQEIYIDHVIHVTHNLDSVTKLYTEKGFTVKPGTKHKNGIENIHIKFSNGSAVEYITLHKEPTDAIAKNYAELLEVGEGGVYIALTGKPLVEVSELLTNNDIKHSIVKGKLWSYLTFPNDSPLNLFFFIEYHKTFKEDLKFTTHSNGIKLITSFSIEHNPKVNDFLNILFPKNSSPIYFSTKTGGISISTNPMDYSIRPRIISN